MNEWKLQWMRGYWTILHRELINIPKYKHVWVIKEEWASERIAKERFEILRNVK